MTPEQADLLLLTLKAAYPHADNGVDAVKAKLRDGIYRNALAGWGYASAQEAVKRVIASCRFYPTVAELHDAYSEANRPRPELAAASNALPAPGHTTASPEEIRSACAAAIATVEANAVLPPLRVPRERADMDRIERELASRKGIATPPEIIRDGKSSAAEGGT